MHHPPIRDVVDRCRGWESHADPEIRRISKPSPDPIYPVYVIGDSDNIGETIRVAAVTRPKSGPDQLMDILKRLLACMATPVPVPAPVPQVLTVEKLLQHLVAETQSRQSRQESPAAGRQSTRAHGIGKVVQILSGQQTSAETNHTGLKWCCMCFMRKVGSCRDSLPSSG